MKLLVLAVFLLNGPFGLAATVGFRCIPSERETRFQALQEDDSVAIRVTNPSGFEMMPLLEGPLSQFQIPFLKMQAEDLKALGVAFEVRWKKSQCAQVDWATHQLTCQSSGQLSVTGIQALSLTSFLVTETGFDSKYALHKYRFIFESVGNYYFVTLMFPDSTCASF